MNIGSIGYSVFAEKISSGYRKNEVPTQNKFEGAGTATRESTSSNNGENIGVTLIGQTAYIARYADSSTPDNPVVKVGNYEVSVNDVDPANATELEMFALMSYLDDTSQSTSLGMSSFGKMSAFSAIAEENGFCEGIKDTDAFFSQKRDWTEIISSIKEVFLKNAQTYEQALDCDNLLSTMLKSEKNTVCRTILQNEIDEMQANVEAGNVDNEPVFQIGGNAYTEDEWDKLLEYVDEVEEEIQEAMELEQEKVLEEKETEAPTLIETSKSALLTYEYTGCTYTNDNPEGKDWNYITWYTEEGMYCEDVNGHVGNNWAFFWEDEEQYNKVKEFIEQFPEDYNMRFASNQTFWKDFLNDEIDMESFMEFLSTTNNGMPNYGIGDAENMYIDKEKAQWTMYMNPPGFFRPLTRMDEFGSLMPDKEYTDEQTGFHWYVNGDGEPYMLGTWRDNFYRHCEKYGIDPVKKFAEITGMLQYLPDGSYAYIGSNAISIKSTDGEKLVISKDDMTYDMLMYMFDNLPETDNYLDLSYWEENMAKAKEAVPKEEFFKYEPSV